MKLQKNEGVALESKRDYVAVMIAGQLFGIPVSQVREILSVQTITPIPLAPKRVAGALNLRGRVVTAINLHSILNLSYYSTQLPPINVVVEHKDELYSLMIESVIDVIQIPCHKIEKTPQTLDDVWKNIADGVFYDDGKIMVMMNINALLTSDNL